MRIPDSAVKNIAKRWLLLCTNKVLTFLSWHRLNHSANCLLSASYSHDKRSPYGIHIYVFISVLLHPQHLCSQNCPMCWRLQTCSQGAPGLNVALILLRCLFFACRMQGSNLNSLSRSQMHMIPRLSCHSLEDVLIPNTLTDLL